MTRRNTSIDYLEGYSRAAEAGKELFPEMLYGLGAMNLLAAGYHLAVDKPYTQELAAATTLGAMGLASAMVLDGVHQYLEHKKNIR